MVVARTEEQADPTRPAPPALRPYLRFARLPGPALEVARRVLDGDPDFRQRVADATTEEEVGTPGWLWLTRPDGWEAALDQLRKDAQDLEVAAREERAERDARRRLTRAEDMARRAEAALTLRAREADVARAEVAEERVARAKAEAELAELRTHLVTLRDERNRAVRTMKEAEAELAHRTSDLRHARHQLRMAETELQQVQQQARQAQAHPAARGVPTVPAAPQTAAAIQAAATAARALADALADAARSLTAETGTPAADAALPTPAATSARGSRRSAPRLPGGILDDSTAAAHHLVGLPGVVLLVDGYNVAKTAWPDVPLVEERDRLVDALGALHARTGATVEVVFDGAEGVETRPVGARQAVHVRFSPAGVPADDVLVARIDEIPVHQPVVVASSDNAVRDGARRRGAGVLTARQLVAALRR